MVRTWIWMRCVVDVRGRGLARGSVHIVVSNTNHSHTNAPIATTSVHASNISTADNADTHPITIHVPMQASVRPRPNSGQARTGARASTSLLPSTLRSNRVRLGERTQATGAAIYTSTTHPHIHPSFHPSIHASIYPSMLPFIRTTHPSTESYTHTHAHNAYTHSRTRRFLQRQVLRVELGLVARRAPPPPVLLCAYPASRPITFELYPRTRWPTGKREPYERY